VQLTNTPAAANDPTSRRSPTRCFITAMAKYHGTHQPTETSYRCSVDLSMVGASVMPPGLAAPRCHDCCYLQPPARGCRTVIRRMGGTTFMTWCALIEVMRDDRGADDDRASYTAWAVAHQHSLLRTAFLICGDHHRAEDLLQEALTKVARRWRRLQHEHPAAYARQIMVRDNISWWRRRHRELIIEMNSPPAPPGDSATDRRLMLQLALAGLTLRQRAVVVLRYYDDLTERETAKLLGVSIGTVKSQTHVALRRLRDGTPELAELLEGMS